MLLDRLCVATHPILLLICLCKLGSKVKPLITSLNPITNTHTLSMCTCVSEATRQRVNLFPKIASCLFFFSLNVTVQQVVVGSYLDYWADGWWLTRCCCSHIPAHYQSGRALQLGTGAEVQWFSWLKASLLLTSHPRLPAGRQDDIRVRRSPHNSKSHDKTSPKGRNKTIHWHKKTWWYQP